MKKILISLLLLFFIQLSAFAEDKPQAMIVLDASGSMWGQIDGKAKITIAKKALNKVVSDWDENVHLGLMAYGHRKKGDCNDIQTLTSIGKLNKKSMLSQVKKISPKGKTPISRSLKKAAEDLRYTEEKATIILISDGMETCDADPCGTAKALESKGIDFVAHVIGFDVDKKTDAQLKCIAESTGGEYFSAKNASSLNLAMGTIAEKVQKAEPKPPVIKKLKKNIQITASEKEGGKWVKAYHYIHKVVDGEVVKIGVKGSYSRKGKAYLEQLPEGQYVLKSTYNHYKVETPVEVKASELSKVHIVMGQTGKAEITASEKEGGKWVKAYHYLYKVVDGEVQKSHLNSSYSRKDKSYLHQLPIGQYLIKSTYNKLKQETPFEIKSGEVTKIQVVMGQTGQVEITAMEKEGGKWVKAYHYLHKVVDGETQGSIDSSYSKKDKSYLQQLPVGQYLIKSTYNKLKQETPFEIKSGEVTKIQVVMGQTGQVEITAMEKEGGKWIKAYHYIHKVVDGETQGGIDSSYSQKNKSYLQQLPVGQYLIKSQYNKLKQETPFEIKSGEVTKVEVVMGQTGQVEITAMEKEGGKWIKAYHYIHKVVDGETQGGIDSSYSQKDKSYLQQLPVGQYLIKSQYNKLKQETPFEIKSGEVTKIQVVMGQTGKVEITASEKEGGKWVKAYHYLHKVIDGEVGPYVEACYSEKQKGCMKKVPVGKYVLRSTFNAFKKDTPFIVEAGKASKVHVTFAQFFVESKCSDMSATINHEIYASNGRMVYSKQGKCSDKLKVPLDNGKYTIESKVGSDVKETKFTLGAGHPDHIIIDMSKTDEEDSHQALIEADKAAAKAIAPVEKAIEEVAQATPEVTIEKVESKTVSIPQKDLIQAYKQVISTSLPELVKVKNCYQQAEDITQAKKCEDMEEAALKQAQASMQKSLGITDNTNNLIKHEEWTDDIKKETLNKAEKEINNMKISIICLDKGAALSQLDNCISKGGEL